MTVKQSKTTEQLEALQATAQTLSQTLIKKTIVPTEGVRQHIEAKQGYLYELRTNNGDVLTTDSSLIAKRVGNDLEVVLEHDTTVIFDHYFELCETDSSCLVWLPSDTGMYYVVEGNSVALADGSQIVHSYGDETALLDIASNQSSSFAQSFSDAHLADIFSSSRSFTETDVIETSTTLTIADTTVAEKTDFIGLAPTITGATPVGTLTYSLRGADEAQFTVDPSTGVISMLAQDFESPNDANDDNIYEVTLVATDSDGNIARAPHTVTVTDVTERQLTLTLESGKDKYVNASEDSINIEVSMLDMVVVVGEQIQFRNGSNNLGNPYTVTDADISAGKATIALNKTDLGSEGDKSITAFLIDVAGNFSDPSNALDITLDTIAPTLLSFAGTEDMQYRTTGNSIFLYAEFSEALVAGGEITVTLNTGGTAILRTWMEEGYEEFLVGYYTIAESDTWTDDLSIISYTVDPATTDLAGNVMTDTSLPLDSIYNSPPIIDPEFFNTNDWRENLIGSPEPDRPYLAIKSGEDTYLNALEDSLTLELFLTDDIMAGHDIQLENQVPWTRSNVGSVHTVTDADIAAGKVTFTFSKADLEPETEGFRQMRAYIDRKQAWVDGVVGNTVSNAIAIILDTIAPTVTGFNLSSQDYDPGDTIEILAHISEALVAGSTITATLNNGATVTLTTSVNSPLLMGDYLVRQGDTSGQLSVTSYTVDPVTTDLAGNVLSSTVMPTGSPYDVTISGTDGDDWLIGASDPYPIVTHEVLYGGDGEDWIFAQKGDDLLFGGDGDDRLYDNGRGNSILFGGDGNDFLFGSGSSGNSVVFGQDDDILFGGEGDDTIYDYEGTNIINGGNGNDTLGGLSFGISKNTYTYTNTTNGDDTIIGFKTGIGYGTVGSDFTTYGVEGVGADVLDLSDALSFKQGVDVLDDFIQFIDTNVDTLINIDMNGVGGTDMSITLKGVTGVDLDTMIADGNIVL